MSYPDVAGQVLYECGRALLDRLGLAYGPPHDDRGDVHPRALLEGDGDVVGVLYLEYGRRGGVRHGLQDARDGQLKHKD